MSFGRLTRMRVDRNVDFWHQQNLTRWKAQVWFLLFTFWGLFLVLIQNDGFAVLFLTSVLLAAAHVSLLFPSHGPPSYPPTACVCVCAEEHRYMQHSSWSFCIWLISLYMISRSVQSSGIALFSVAEYICAWIDSTLSLSVHMSTAV